MQGQARQHDGANQHAKALAPPRYGIDFVDSGAPVQRKVGFEFETGVLLEKPADTLYKDRKNPFYKDSRFDIISDSGELEFRTDPFEETMKGRESLRHTLADLRSVGYTIMTHAAALGPSQTTFRAEELEAAGGTVEVADVLLKPNAELKGGGPLIANPQATVGARIARIPKLMERIAASGRMGSAEPYSANAEPKPGLHNAILSKASARAQAATKNLGGDNKLQGLLALVASYLIAGALRAETSLGPAPYPKYYSPLLGKANLGLIFAELKANEQKLFANIPATLEALGYPKSEKEYVFPSGYHLALDNVDRSAVHRGPTRGEWLASIASGHDSFAGFIDAKWPAPGLSDMHLEKVGKEPTFSTQESGAVMEMRRMQQFVPIDAWPAAALEVFDMVLAVNK